MSDRPEAGSAQTVTRRRRTRRHRGHRLMRRAVSAAALVALGLLISAAVLLRLGPSVFRAPGSVETDRQSAEASLERLLQVEQEALRSLDDRPVYPYSVVPGGVRDAQELKWAADHDPVVAAHYAGFDYDHARIVRLVLARTAYVSYRIGNKVYWTRHRVSLKKGETLITDGKITTRTRCANRVEEAPQQLSSSPEPPAAKFEEPIHPSVGTAIESPPVPFQSALLSRPGLPEPAPLPALSLSSPFGNGVWVPIAPPPLPSVCGVSKPKGGGGGTGGHKGTGNPCPSGGVVPEPDTWLLVASGLAAIYWKARRTLAGSWGNPDQGFCGPR